MYLDHPTCYAYLKIGSKAAPTMLYNPQHHLKKKKVEFCFLCFVWILQMGLTIMQSNVVQIRHYYIAKDVLIIFVVQIQALKGGVEIVKD